MTRTPSSSRNRNVAFLLLTVVGSAACGTSDPVPPVANRAPTAVMDITPAEVPRDDANTTLITLDASGSSDPDGDILGIVWTAPDATFESGTNSNSQIALVSFPGTMNYTVTLDVTDGQAPAAQATGTVFLANAAPLATATATPDSVPTGDGNTTVVTLDASGSSDPDGDPFTFAWTVPSGTFVSGTSASSETPEVTFPGSGDYATSVIVTDSFGAADTASVTVFLKP